MKYKIGQKIVFTNSYDVDTAKGTTVKVVKGDEAMVVKKIAENEGQIIYTTGEAAGLISIISIEVDDKVDEEYIAKRILEGL